MNEIVTATEDVQDIVKYAMAASDLAIPDRGPLDKYAGAGQVTMTEDQAKALMATFQETDYDVLPSGEIYIPQVQYRRRLNAVLGPGGWALVPQGRYTFENNLVYREYHLVVDGKFVSSVIGECGYSPTNKRMTYGDAMEGAKSNALSRACKDLGIGAECWDKRFATSWRSANCTRSGLDGKWVRLEQKKTVVPTERIDAAQLKDLIAQAKSVGLDQGAYLARIEATVGHRMPAKITVSEYAKVMEAMK